MQRRANLADKLNLFIKRVSFGSKDCPKCGDKSEYFQIIKKIKGLSVIKELIQFEVSGCGDLLALVLFTIYLQT